MSQYIVDGEVYIEHRFLKKTVKIETDKSKEQEEIFKGWLNGPQEAVNQEDIYNEYITGKETTGKGAN